MKIQKISSLENHNKVSKKHPTFKQRPSCEYSSRSTQIEDLTLDKWSQLNLAPCMLRLKKPLKKLAKSLPLYKNNLHLHEKKTYKGNHKQQRERESCYLGNKPWRLREVSIFYLIGVENPWKWYKNVEIVMLI